MPGSGRLGAIRSPLSKVAAPPIGLTHMRTVRNCASGRIAAFVREVSECRSAEVITGTVIDSRAELVKYSGAVSGEGYSVEGLAQEA